MPRPKGFPLTMDERFAGIKVLEEMDASLKKLVERLYYNDIDKHEADMERINILKTALHQLITMRERNRKTVHRTQAAKERTRLRK